MRGRFVGVTSSEESGSEISCGWRVVAASALGVTCGVTAVPIYTVGAFVAPLQQEFGWSRGEIQAATVFAYLAVVVAGPLAGGIADRHGARVVALWSIVGIALGVASAAALTHSLAGLYAAYALIGVLGAGTAPGIWTRAISGWFDRRRGLALGLTLMGTGIFATFGPRYVTWAIETFGWRGGYLALAVLPLVIVLPAALAWFRERPVSAIREAAAETSSAASGLDLAAALRTPSLWLLMVTFLMFSTVISGVIGSFIPMLTDSGYTPAEAAATAGVIGLAVMAGRVAVGLMLDRVAAPILSAIVMSLPALACALWAGSGGGSAAPILAAVLVGLAGGAEFDLVAYMAARYFGLTHYGKITSVLFSAIIAGGALGPALFGYSFDAFGGYGQVLAASAAIFVVAGAAQLVLLRWSAPSLVRP
ncbi:MAG: MFS transporter [Rhodospirillaceae bacterium]|nr:MFS transporter [Rhodospirillaceae bacterium]